MSSKKPKKKLKKSWWMRKTLSIICFTHYQEVEPFWPIRPSFPVLERFFSSLGENDISRRKFITHRADILAWSQPLAAPIAMIDPSNILLPPRRQPTDIIYSFVFLIFLLLLVSFTVGYSNMRISFLCLVRWFLNNFIQLIIWVWILKNWRVES